MTKIDDLIIGFLNNQLNKSQKEGLKNWLDKSSSNREHFKELEALYNASEIIGNPKKYIPDFNNSHLQTQILVDEKTRKIKSRYLFINVASVAAVVLMAVIFGSVLLNPKLFKSENTNIAYQEISTPKGSRSQIILSDGTKVWLNADSKLIYPGQFDGDKREVKLIGEAYFDVYKNKDKPFYVRAGEIDVRVTGTSFNVKNYPDENTIETTLIEGEVIIQKANYGKGEPTQLVTLKPNEKITFIKGVKNGVNELIPSADETENELVLPVKSIKNAVLTKNANVEKAVSWKYNKVIFEKESFEKIVNQLERRFGVVFIFNSESTKNIQFTGTFDEVSIEGALEAMSFASPFGYKLENDTIVISNN
ncbi:FecR family protein [Prolixibacteraceae bacterium Z1-6]|uniref:FecR family protein n=1 Tax=Draconibacterium aestuarii TaxID=2998507 RepID=A0A9X3F8V3_9BACT|nr:FecR family protein [Prolixibacteraceae bacterium Z1-6]